MEEKYIKNNVWQLHSPLQHVGTFVTKSLNSDGQVKSRKIAIISKNIGSKKITAYKGQIKSKDAFNQNLKDSPFSFSEIENFSTGFVQGEDIFFTVPKEAVSYEIYYEVIIFSDLSQREFDKITYLNFKELNLEQPTNLLKKVWSIYNSEFKPLNFALVTNDYLICPCGSLNLVDKDKCLNCNIEKKLINNFTSEVMIDELIEKRVLDSISAAKKKVNGTLIISKDDLISETKSQSKKLIELKNSLKKFELANELFESLLTIEKSVLKTKTEYVNYLKSKELLKEQIEKIEIAISKEINEKKKIELNSYEEKVEGYLNQKAFIILDEFLVKNQSALIKHPKWALWSILNEFKATNIDELINRSLSIEQKRELIDLSSKFIINKNNLQLLEFIEYVATELDDYDNKKAKTNSVLKKIFLFVTTISLIIGIATFINYRSKFITIDNYYRYFELDLYYRGQIDPDTASSSNPEYISVVNTLQIRPLNPNRFSYDNVVIILEYKYSWTECVGQCRVIIRKQRVSIPLSAYGNGSHTITVEGDYDRNLNNYRIDILPVVIEVSGRILD